jgi:hypothetical protein
MEFLSERTCQHPIYHNSALWIALMKQRVVVPPSAPSPLPELKTGKRPRALVNTVLSEAQSLLFIMLELEVNSSRALLFIQGVASDYGLAINEYFKLQRTVNQIWLSHSDEAVWHEQEQTQQPELKVPSKKKKDVRRTSALSIGDMLSMQGHESGKHFSSKGGKDGASSAKRGRSGSAGSDDLDELGPGAQSFRQAQQAAAEGGSRRGSQKERGADAAGAEAESGVLADRVSRRGQSQLGQIAEEGDSQDGAGDSDEDRSSASDSNSPRNGGLGLGLGLGEGEGEGGLHSSDLLRCAYLGIQALPEQEQESEHEHDELGAHGSDSDTAGISPREGKKRASFAEDKEAEDGAGMGAGMGTGARMRLEAGDGNVRDIAMHLPNKFLEMSLIVSTS